MAKFDPMVFFASERDCVGYVRDLRGRQRRFSARFTGRLDNGRLHIDEQMAYEDGEEVRRIWSMTVAPGGWRAEADDIPDRAEIQRFDDVTAIWRYRLRHRGARGDIVLRLADRMVLTADGTVASETRITKFGLPVAHVWALYVPAGRLAGATSVQAQGLGAASSAISA